MAVAVALTARGRQGMMRRMRNYSAREQGELNSKSTTTTISLSIFALSTQQINPTLANMNSTVTGKKYKHAIGARSKQVK
jgi:hypothetical protein